jgi:hypothetical protein
MDVCSEAVTTEQSSKSIRSRANSVKLIAGFTYIGTSWSERKPDYYRSDSNSWYLYYPTFYTWKNEKIRESVTLAGLMLLSWQ